MTLFRQILLSLAVVLLSRTPPVLASMITVSENRGDPGDTAVLVTVSLENTKPYAGMELVLEYNLTVLDLNRIEPASRLSGLSETGYYEYSSGKVSVVVFDITGIDLPADTGVILSTYFDISPDTSFTEGEIVIAEITAVADDLSYDTLTVQNGFIGVPSYICGDVNGDEYGPNVADLTYLVDYLFRGGPAPPVMEAADVDLSGHINVADLTYLVNFLFRGGPAPCHPDRGGAGAKLFADAVPSTCEIVSEPVGENNYKLTIHVDLETDVAGFQQEYGYDNTALDIDSIVCGKANEAVDLYYIAENGTISLGMIDLTGEHFIKRGKSVAAHIFLHTENGIELTQGHLSHHFTIAADRNAQVIPLNVKTDRLFVAVPQAFSLAQNYPNPFNPTTVIKYSLPKQCKVRVDVYNILGQKVKTLIDRLQPAGYFEVTWNGENSNGKPAASGVYFYRIEAGDFTAGKKMLLLK